MKVTNLEAPLFVVYSDPNGYGFYAISENAPQFCIHAPSLASLGTRVAAAIKFYKIVDKSKSF